MKPYDYQEELAKEGFKILQQFMIVYFAMEERTGKSLTALLTAEHCTTVNKVLILTKKKALDGWKETLEDFGHCLTKDYTVTNYHQAKKEISHYDLVILDEAHNYISAFPKVGAMWKDIAKLTAGKPLIYLSATPDAQGPQMLYHQFKLSSWSPWKHHGNFYQWFKLYGKPYQIEINGIKVNQYDKCHVDMIKDSVSELFIAKSRKELGFVHEPKDKLHYIELSDLTKVIYNELVEHQIVKLNEGTLVCDTVSKLRFSLHMLEGGVAKVDDNYIVCTNTEKID